MSFQEISAVLGNWGEFLGAIAVVITLGYLALQIRENTKTNRVVARQHFADQVTSFFDDFVRDPELADMYRRGLENPQELGATDTQRFETLLRKSFVYMSSQYYQHHIGAMDDETWHEARFYMRWHAEQPGVARWWSASKAIFSPSFRAYMDHLFEREERPDR